MSTYISHCSHWLKLISKLIYDRYCNWMPDDGMSCCLAMLTRNTGNQTSDKITFSPRYPSYTRSWSRYTKCEERDYITKWSLLGIAGFIISWLKFKNNHFDLDFGCSKQRNSLLTICYPSERKIVSFNDKQNTKRGETYKKTYIMIQTDVDRQI